MTVVVMRRILTYYIGVLVWEDEISPRHVQVLEDETRHTSHTLSGPAPPPSGPLP